MIRYLVLEDDQNYIETAYGAFSRLFNHERPGELDIVYTSSLAAARHELSKGRFDGAFLDLQLSSADDEQVEGNDMAREIYNAHFIPIAIVTADPNRLEDDVETIAQGSSLIKVFNKSGDIGLAFEFLLRIYNSGILKIVGPGGEMLKFLSVIFWRHLGSIIDRWEAKELTPTDRNRVLRHAVSHMLTALQSDLTGNWDKFLAGEVYIWPPISTNHMTGDIFKCRTSAAFFLLVTPACDLPRATQATSLRHFLPIMSFGGFGKDKVRGIMAKKDHKCHLLPPTDFFEGGIIDFSGMSTLTLDACQRDFDWVGSVVEPYAREITARLGAWISRQGTPDLDSEGILATIFPAAG